ncbi:hypothetical protein GYMLUDRAFT_51068 [Collybiopsis luxurians FD-317 M1]|uniref:Uncharacterized protein n=1 Tax=Collybiopsis luxurians FD-317 M1 TaxID=944289 RepID=A0A0D0B8Y1_9AGAR|nr:hypothetical protein GYMLUDRAFT_51068 [Collybiopsis luxurians FD-317 M1]
MGRFGDGGDDGGRHMYEELPVGAYLWGNVEYLSFADPSLTDPFARFDAISMRSIKFMYLYSSVVYSQTRKGTLTCNPTTRDTSQPLQYSPSSSPSRHIPRPPPSTPTPSSSHVSYLHIVPIPSNGYETKFKDERVHRGTGDSPSGGLILILTDPSCKRCVWRWARWA